MPLQVTDAWKLLEDITDDLAKSYKELASVEASNLETYWNSWLSSPAESITGRNREAEAATYQFEGVAIELKGKIKSLEKQYDFYKLVIQSG